MGGTRVRNSNAVISTPRVVHVQGLWLICVLCSCCACQTSCKHFVTSPGATEQTAPLPGRCTPVIREYDISNFLHLLLAAAVPLLLLLYLCCCCCCWCIASSARCESICEMLRRQELLAAAGLMEGE
jgi:hypothetical protein